MTKDLPPRFCNVHEILRHFVPQDDRLFIGFNELSNVFNLIKFVGITQLRMTGLFFLTICGDFWAIHLKRLYIFSSPFYSLNSSYPAW